MSSKTKRITFSESDCHALVDIIINYKDIVECKKTDAVTWKQKITAWEKIAVAYNSLTTDPRTSEQLRCKFDNLKKDVRKYEAKKRQELYKTGGGIDDCADVKATLKLLYEKIKSIISLSVAGLEPSQGDSDVFVDNNKTSSTVLSQELDSRNNILIDTDNTDNLLIISTKNTEVYKVEDFPKHTDAGLNQKLEIKNEVKNDWSDYTPRQLQTKKHKVLQVKRKRNPDETSNQNVDIENEENLVLLKKRLLKEESIQNKKYYEDRSRREEELHLLKTKNMTLQNEKLEIEILLLKKQLNTIYELM